MKKKLVMFCGAGFSAPFGIPTMAGFTDRLRDSQFLKPDEQADFDRIQLTCDSLGALIGSSSRNLEQLSSFLSVMKIARPDFEFAGCEKFKTPWEALRLVKRCIHHLVDPLLTSQRVVLFVQQLQAVFETYNVSFVTTNYDLVLELARYQPGNEQRVRPTPIVLGEAKDLAGRLYTADPNAPAIFKLHGSLNWYDVSNKFVVLDKTKHVDATTTTGLVGSALDLAGAPNADDVMIVPPSVIKPQLNVVYEEQWDGACQAMSDADAIWFIGYSFPESDSFMRYFLASALTDNARIRQLLVISPDMGVKARCLSIFRSPRLREGFAFLPCKWNEVHFWALLQDNPLQAAHTGLLRNVDADSEWARKVVFAPME